MSVRSLCFVVALLVAGTASGQIFDTPGVLTPSPDATASPDLTASPDETPSPDLTASPDDTGTPDATVSPDGTGTPDVTASPDGTETASPDGTTTASPEGTTTPGTPGEETPTAGTPTAPTAMPTPTLAPPPNLTVADGYAISNVVTGLDFPTAIAFSFGRVWVSEAGALPGTTLALVPRVREITDPDAITTILSADELPEGTLEGPLTDLTFHDDALWLVHRQRAADGTLVGAISRFDPDDAVASFTTVLTNLPSAGDWYTEEIVFDADGRAYFAQGSATNAAVVGPDNFLATGWLEEAPTFHDYAPVDLLLNGMSFPTIVPFPLDPDASQVTPPFAPFGTGPIEPGTAVTAATPDAPQDGFIVGNAAIYSFDPASDDAAATVQLEAWGTRNPFGITVDPTTPGRLYVTNNGADLRAAPIDGTLTVITSRPLSNDGDDLFVVEAGGDIEFFGWPDYFHDPVNGAPLPATDPLFCEPEADLLFPCPTFVLDATFRSGLVVGSAAAQLGLHVAAAKLDASPREDFAPLGELFIAESGAFVPITGATALVGYKVVRVDPATGTVTDFVSYTDPTEEELFAPDAFSKPIDAKFFDARLFIVDFGVFEPGLELQEPGTGKVWSVVRSPAPPPTCPPDTPQCTDDGELTISDLVGLVALALGEPGAECPGFDGGDDGEVTIDEITRAVNGALGPCGPPPATPVPTGTAGPPTTPGDGTLTPGTTGTPETPPGTPDATATISPDDGTPDATGTPGLDTPSPEGTATPDDDGFPTAAPTVDDGDGLPTPPPTIDDDIDDIFPTPLPTLDDGIDDIFPTPLPTLDTSFPGVPTPLPTLDTSFPGVPTPFPTLSIFR